MAGMLLQVKTIETHGYNAVQVGYQVVPERKITKPELNHLKKSGCPPMRKLKEYRVRATSLVRFCFYTLGQSFHACDKVSLQRLESCKSAVEGGGGL